MSQRILFVFAVGTILSFTACDFNKSNDSETALLATATSEEVLSNTPIVAKVEKKTFPEFIYDVGPRFGVIKKTDLDTIRSFNDIIAKEHAGRIVYYKSLSVTILDGDQQTDEKVTGNDGNFTPKQLQLLQSLDYSTNMLIMAEYREKSFDTGELEDSAWTPYLTVVPEKQAKYTFGKDVLKEYLRIKSEASRANVDPEKMRAAKLFFTVTKTGSIENVNLDRHSGYQEVDDKMIELIKSTKNAWEPAENAKGEKVDQELVVSFGLMGC